MKYRSLFSKRQFEHFLMMFWNSIEVSSIGGSGFFCPFCKASIFTEEESDHHKNTCGRRELEKTAYSDYRYTQI